MKPDDRAGAPQLVPDGNQALADLQELFALANVSPELAVRVEQALQEGPPLRVAYVDYLPAVGAMNGIAVYQLSQRLHALLAAARIGARNRDPDVFDGNKSSHAAFLRGGDYVDRTGAPADVTVTPEMIEAALVELYAYDPETSDGRSTVRAIMEVTLANQLPRFRTASDP